MSKVGQMTGDEEGITGQTALNDHTVFIWQQRAWLS